MLGKLYALTFCLQIAGVLNSLNGEENMISLYLKNEKVCPSGISSNGLLFCLCNRSYKISPLHRVGLGPKLERY